MVKSPDAGIEIFVRNKRPANMTSFRPERTLVYVHGATYPASTAFDLKLDGLSWMEYIASRGYDVYLLDLRGYGNIDEFGDLARSTSAGSTVIDLGLSNGGAAGVDLLTVAGVVDLAATDFAFA